MSVLTLLGVVGCTLWSGLSGGSGFLLGAGFSILNFWSWHRLVRRIGDPGQVRTANASAAAFGMRYVLFAAAGYAIIQYFRASLFAALAGCFVAVAVIILEILL